MAETAMGPSSGEGWSFIGSDRNERICGNIEESQISESYQSPIENQRMKRLFIELALDSKRAGALNSRRLCGEQGISRDSCHTHASSRVDKFQRVPEVSKKDKRMVGEIGHLHRAH